MIFKNWTGCPETGYVFNCGVIKSVKKKRILFDIDGTLTYRINSNPSRKQMVFTRCVQSVYDLADINYMDYPIFGMTDRGILYFVLGKNGLRKDEISRCEAEFIRLLKSQYTAAIQDGKREYTALPGVKQLLDSVSDIPTGLATGNLEQIAFHKLADAGLDRYFSIGGFGEDAVDRVGIIKTAIQRLGASETDDVILFGDTPNDIVSGQKAGCRIGAVSTGRHSREELQKHCLAADTVFDSFESFRDVLEFIGIPF
jgi:phosphoglycolate phosphatase